MIKIVPMSQQRRFCGIERLTESHYKRRLSEANLFLEKPSRAPGSLAKVGFLGTG